MSENNNNSQSQEANDISKDNQSRNILNTNESKQCHLKTNKTQNIYTDKEIIMLRNKLKEQQKERFNSQRNHEKMKNKVKALKLEESKAMKKMEHTKQSIENIEKIRKGNQENKQLLEDYKQKQEKILEMKKKQIAVKSEYTKSTLSNWKLNLAKNKFSAKMALKEERKQLMKQINVYRQDEEEKNKQLCIQVKNDYLYKNGDKALVEEQKKEKLKEELMEKIKNAVDEKEDYNKDIKYLEDEESKIVENLKTIHQTEMFNCISFLFRVHFQRWEGINSFSYKIKDCFT